jgi:metal-responsive CopG/Arc/MetJ family transcriptional regulator
MSQNSAGRPAKANRERRKQLQLSLYEDDIARLEQLTDNRSEFVRDCIARAWSQKHDGDQTITLTVPKWLIRELLELMRRRVPASRAALVQVLVEELLSTNGEEQALA